MQTLPAAMTTEKNKTAGAKPVWILKLSRTGTTPLYISDRVLTITAADGTTQTTKAWVSSWGVLKEGITNGLGEMSIADYDLHLLADPTDAANIIYQVDTYDIETSTAEVQHWYEGMVAGTAAIKKFVGYVKEVSVDQNDEGVSLRLQDATLKLQGTLGTVLDSDTYPLADPDHIGKLLPIVFGTVNKLPALCVDAGWVTSLAQAISPTDYFFELSDVPETTKNKTIYVDNEQITLLNDPADVFEVSNAWYGSVAWGNTEYGGTYVASQTNNGDKKGAAGAYWQQAAGAAYNHITNNFKYPTKIYELYLFSVQDNYNSPADVDWTSTLTGSLYVIQDFDVYYCTDDQYNWQLLKQVRNNDKIVCRVGFDTPVTALHVLVVMLRSPDNWMRVVELAILGTYDKKMTVTRGANSTTPVNHAMGATVIEKKATPIVFLLADHPLETIGNIYIRVAGIDVDITGLVTKYLGTSGNQLAAYPGKAAITIATTPSVMQQLYLTINNALNLNQGNHTHPTVINAPQIIRPNGAGNVYNGTSANNWNSTFAQNCWDGNADTYMTGYQQSHYAEFSGGPENQNVVKFYTNAINNIANLMEVRVGCICQTPGYGAGVCYLRLIVNGVEVCQLAIPNNAPKGTYQTGWFALNDFSQIYNNGGAHPTSYISMTMTNVPTSYLFDIWFEYRTGTATTYSAATGVALTGDLSLIGNNISNVYTMDQLMANVARPSVNTPLLACNDILSRVNYPAATGSSNITTAINGAITTPQSALYWLTKIAFESWALFKVSSAGSLLVPRGAGASQKPITAAMVRNSSRRKSAYEDIINKINLKFDFDYSNTTNDPYRQTTSATDATSQARYGIQDRPDLFLFQFITSASIATALRDAYLTWYSARHWVHEVEVFLDNIEVEFGDSITLAFIAGSPVGFVREARVAPGDDSEPDTITLVVEV